LLQGERRKRQRPQEQEGQSFLHSCIPHEKL
jgi:hypothetical protein